jgi:hypothetical protein
MSAYVIPGDHGTRVRTRVPLYPVPEYPHIASAQRRPQRRSDHLLGIIYLLGRNPHRIPKLCFHSHGMRGLRCPGLTVSRHRGHGVAKSLRLRLRLQPRWVQRLSSRLTPSVNSTCAPAALRQLGKLDGLTDHSQDTICSAQRGPGSRSVGLYAHSATCPEAGQGRGQGQGDGHTASVGGRGP